VVRGAYLLLIASILLTYLEVVLHLFPWTRGIATGFLGYLADPIRHIVLAAVGFVPNLLFLAVLFVMTRFVLKAIHLFASSIESGAVAVIAFAVIVAYPYIPGSQSLAFKGVSLFVGVLFSLGSSSVISNILAGYTMTYRRAFKIGDRIEVDNSIGEVVETRLLVTHLRTAKNEEVILPNSLILNGKVINYSSIAKRQGLILHTTVGIGYETPWRQVEAMLLAAAAAASDRLPSLLKDPKPFVLQRALGDFCITYEINVYTDAPGAMLAGYAELHRNILDVFNEYGVQIMTPAYEGDPEQAKLVPKDQWHAAPAPPPQGETPGSDRKR
jgi:small-conductance mechanosensitive channel